MNLINNKEVRIFLSLGFPGNNRRIDISYSIDDVKAIRVELKMVFLLDEQSLCVKGQREIPLTRVGQPMTLEEIETSSRIGSILQKIYY
jgi:hypothetical protein